jgi:prepilin-type N-terminal cleavage/methylation domain-containing protein
MIKREQGFTLIELMITMVAFVLVIASVSSIFLGLVNQFKQQSKIAETNTEGIVGLEILRQDIEHTGYGLPWNVTGVTDVDGDGNLWEDLPSYFEAAGSAAVYNDAPVNSPRAILSGNGLGGFNGSDDYLVIKAVNVARNYACRKWTTLRTTGTRVWNPNKENVNFNDADGTTNNNIRVITISPGSTETNSMSLVASDAAFSTNFSSVTIAPWQPTEDTETRLVYGVDPSTNLRMPFNRADYFISNANIPQRCAPNTGILVKAVLRHNDGGFDLMPLLDCVADMQVVYCLDNDNDGDCEVGVAGSTDSYSDDISTQNAEWIRERVKQVRVYILAHEGQRDPNYTYPTNSIDLPAAPDPGFGLGSSFNFTSHGITNYQNYRWKVYTIVVNPNNLR